MMLSALRLQAIETVKFALQMFVKTASEKGVCVVRIVSGS
jgi:hypothetical protein